jgi:hypothetical protein
MTKTVIPSEIQQKVIEIIDKFNQKQVKGKLENLFYFPKFKFKFRYLKRKEYCNISPVARLTYYGNMEDWHFAIFKWSSESYDPDECFFSGIQHVDLTIERAMKAGMKAYPV